MTTWGKSFGLGAVGFVAAGADDGGVELRRLYRCGIVSMLGLGSVAGFAGDNHMPALLFMIDDVGMAGLAYIVAGEGDGPGRDLSNGSAAIVSVLAKALRNDEGAQGDECDHCDRHDHREPDEMFNVLEQSVRPTPGASRVIWRDALGYLEIVRRTMSEVTGSCDGAHDALSLRSNPKRLRGTRKRINNGAFFWERKIPSLARPPGPSGEVTV